MNERERNSKVVGCGGLAQRGDDGKLFLREGLLVELPRFLMSPLELRERLLHLLLKVMVMVISTCSRGYEPLMKKGGLSYRVLDGRMGVLLVGRQLDEQRRQPGGHRVRHALHDGRQTQRSAVPHLLFRS